MVKFLFGYNSFSQAFFSRHHGVFFGNPSGLTFFHLGFRLDLQEIVQNPNMGVPWMSRDGFFSKLGSMGSFKFGPNSRSWLVQNSSPFFNGIHTSTKIRGKHFPASYVIDDRSLSILRVK